MKNMKYLIGLAIFAIVAVWSGIGAYEATLWFLEAGICLVGVAILIGTFGKFKFTDLTYTIILIELIILLVGAHYSYARVPLFNWIRDTLGLERNDYDKLGHFFQGFTPAFISREIIVRLKVTKNNRWTVFFIICISLSISAFYEMIEWWGALVFKGSADDFLGMQGYEWDTQSDMLCALIGAICMVLFFGKIQDKQIDKIETK